MEGIPTKDIKVNCLFSLSLSYACHVHMPCKGAFKHLLQLIRAKKKHAFSTEAKW